MLFGSLFPGFALGAGLIVAIGAQNAYVLRQGLRGHHVFLIVSICAGFDIALIAVGIAGAGALIQRHLPLLTAIRYLGAALLLFYSYRSFRSAWVGGAHLDAANDSPASASAAAVTALALSALNPHVYLDTVVLLGSIGGQRPMPDRAWFAAGAMLASASWFVALGYGARILRPLFAKEIAWRILDVFVGIVMLVIAVTLLV